MVWLALRKAAILANGTTFGAWRSPVSALVWETRGRRFKSSRSDHFLQEMPQCLRGPVSRAILYLPKIRVCQQLAVNTRYVGTAAPMEPCRAPMSEQRRQVDIAPSCPRRRLARSPGAWSARRRSGPGPRRRPRGTSRRMQPPLQSRLPSILVTESFDFLMYLPARLGRSSAQDSTPSNGACTRS